MARSADIGGTPLPRPDARPAGESQAASGKRGPIGFIGECWAELKKVEWPGQAQVVQGTVVVIIACIIVGIFLYANDQLWKPVVQKIFLGQ